MYMATPCTYNSPERPHLVKHLCTPYTCPVHGAWEEQHETGAGT